MKLKCNENRTMYDRNVMQNYLVEQVLTVDSLN